MENVRKYRIIKPATTEIRKNYMVSEPICHTTKEKKKAQIFLNKPIHLGLLILEFWYNYAKPKYGKKAKLCYMNTSSFIVYTKTNFNYKYIAEDVKIRFDTSNYKLDRPVWPNG